MPKRKIVIDLNLTPEELADRFCEFSSDEQARFFNEIGVITSKWVNPFCFQMQRVSDSTQLSSHGIDVMRTIGEYAISQSKYSTNNCTHPHLFWGKYF